MVSFKRAPTASTTEELRKGFTDNPDESNASFLAKLKGQLANVSPQAKRLMAEMLWALMLFQSNISPPKKRETVGQVWGWSGNNLDLAHPLLSDATLIGIGSPGTAFNTARWRELNYVIGIASALQLLAREERSAVLLDRERFEQWIAKAPQDGHRQFRHIFRYLAFPDQNERITQNRDRAEILEALAGVEAKQARRMSDKEQDDRLFALREQLRSELGTSDFDFYSPPLSDRWRLPRGPSKRSETLLAFDAGYAELRELFLKKYPGFKSFGTDARYHADERGYKDELLRLFEETIESQLANADWPAAGEAAIGILTKKLEQEKGRPQNIVGWRYVDLLRKLRTEQRAVFARILNDLLDEDAPIEERVERFVTEIRRLLGEGQKLIPAAIRSITGFYLTLSEPKRHIFLKTDEMARALSKLDPSFRWLPGGLTGAEVANVEALAKQVFDRLVAEGWVPKDLLDAQGFLWAAITNRNGVAESKGDSTEDYEAMSTKPPASQRKPLNQILYGPPGTGKTWTTARLAVEICNGTASQDRGELMSAYKELVRTNRVVFTTFHQSIGYEEFVEGLRPTTDNDDDEQGEGRPTTGFRLVPTSGIFRNTCALADQARKRKRKAGGFDFKGRQFFKMSLGRAHIDSQIYDEAIDGNYIVLGWGGDYDWSAANFESYQAIFDRWKQDEPDKSGRSGDVSQLWCFRSSIKKGDIVVVSEGLSRYRAIGEVTGDYQFVPQGIGGNHRRAVRWLAVLQDSLPIETIHAGKLTSASCYQLSRNRMKLDALVEQISTEPVSESSPPDAYVLVIDEINRANVSKVLGELITLLEPDKRLGGANELTVTLPYSGDEFGVPDNLYVIGTMNTADRSIALLDTALRRRFKFSEMMPDYDCLDREIDGIHLGALLCAINRRIEWLFDRDHQIGHSFLLGIEDKSELDEVMRRKIIPLLAEYFYDDWEKVRAALNDSGQWFISVEKLSVPPLLKDEGEERSRYVVRGTDIAFDGYRAAADVA